MGVAPSISKSRDVRHVMDTGDKVVCRNFICFSVVCASGESEAFAFVVTRKFGNACRRNRVKRRMRVLARDRFLGKGMRCVFLARPAAGTAPFSDIDKEFRYAAGRLYSQSVKRAAASATAAAAELAERP